MTFGTRHIQALLLFIGMAISEAVGVALSVGIVAMTDVFNMNAQVEVIYNILLITYLTTPTYILHYIYLVRIFGTEGNIPKSRNNPSNS